MGRGTVWGVGHSYWARLKGTRCSDPKAQTAVTAQSGRTHTPQNLRKKRKFDDESSGMNHNIV